MWRPTIEIRISESINYELFFCYLSRYGSQTYQGFYLLCCEFKWNNLTTDQSIPNTIYDIIRGSIPIGCSVVINGTYSTEVSLKYPQSGRQVGVLAPQSRRLQLRQCRWWVVPFLFHSSSEIFSSKPKSPWSVCKSRVLIIQRSHKWSKLYQTVPCWFQLNKALLFPELKRSHCLITHSQSKLDAILRPNVPQCAANNRR